MNRVLDLVLSKGCRMAEPGEFTKRAFLGGRIDLARAEAVMDLISSQNEFSRRNAAAQMSGSVSLRIRSLREKILYEIAFIESALDDPENYTLEGYTEKLSGVCSELEREISSILTYSEEGRILQEGIRTAWDLMGADRIFIEAEDYVEGYYTKAGFFRTSDVFLKDEIPHVHMELWK